MSDTLTAPATPGTVAAPVVPETPKAASSIAEAGAELRGAASWQDLNFPSIDVTDGESDPPTTPADAPAPSDPQTVEGEFVQDANGAWHRADGTMASADEIAAIDAQIKGETAPLADDPKPETTDNVVTLRRRDGTTRDVIVDDPELAQEIRQNMNDGLRRRDYVEKMATLETKEAEYREFATMLRTNPEAVILQHLPAEKQVSIAAQLLAQHFDALVPIIQGYDTNPSTRLEAVTKAQTTIREQETNFNSLVVSQRQASEVKTAVAALIPDATPDETQEKFWKFASMELTAAVDAGKPVNKDTVKGLLADLLTHYGFAGAAPAAPAKPRITLAPTAPAPSPAAVPANDAAKQLADAAATQKRIKLTQRNRANAAAVPPVGAGAAPVRLPPVPQGASIEQASASLKKMRGWSS